MKNEGSFSADEHYSFLDFVLSVFGNSMSNVVAVVGDNCTTNLSMSRRIGPTILGYHSHLFNLFVKDFIEKHNDVVCKIVNLMKKLRFHIPAAKLRRLTPLVALQANDTRWSPRMRCFADIRNWLSFSIK